MEAAERDSDPDCQNPNDMLLPLQQTALLLDLHQKLFLRVQCLIQIYMFVS